MTSPIDCPDCTTITAGIDNDGLPVAGIRMCQQHKDRSARRIAAARATNPAVDAIHRRIAAHKAGR